MSVKSIDLQCPMCKSADIGYTQSATEHWSISSVDADGHVELDSLDDSSPDDNGTLQCRDCFTRMYVSYGEVRLYHAG